MDLKTNKRNILGILIITLIFGVFSIISMTRMFDGAEKQEEVVKKDYLVLLEEELGNKIEVENEFEVSTSIGKELIIEPVKYKYYFKPCFDFIVEADGVKITNSLAKEFYDMNLEVGMKIIAINDETLSGKSYFEILEKIYAKNINEKKTFTLSDSQKIEYTYSGYNNRYDYNEDTKTLSVYDLDLVNQETIYEFYSNNPNMILDLSKATLNTFDGVKNFVSMFVENKEILFKTPEGIKAIGGRKINQLTIVIGTNTDNGVLFALTNISKLNSNIKIVENINDTTNMSLNTTTFYALKELRSSNYTIYLKNYLMETKANTSGDIEI